MPNPCQEPLASYKASNQDLKEMNLLCTFKIKIESQNLEHGCMPNRIQESPASPKARSYDMGILCNFKFKIENQKPQSEANSILNKS